ncbi:F-box protein CPR1-like [Euphorbia lathyris]|uniref:F-box protein CPR1-like n=1 Tax=Euphorbia lathyris TaxID=212925 RepID=UPI00331373F3
MAQLPQELIIEILLWLPVESLLRFRCLSKFLRGVIDSPDFINSHLSKSSQNFNLRKLIFQHPYREKFHVRDMILDPEEEILLLRKPVSSLWKEVSWKEVYGYCKGLLLLYGSASYFGLARWNPSTRQHRDLPDCPFKLPSNVEYYRIIGSGLGYDDSTDDYRAFFIVQVQLEFHVWIYGLKSNSWRRAQNFPYVGYKFDTDPGIAGLGFFTTDGSIHWLCSLDSDPWQSEIVTFDMRKETFSIVSQPVCRVEGFLKELHVLEGCLCISYFSGCPFSIPLPLQSDLYIRKKNGDDQFTWTKLFSVTRAEPLFFHISWFQTMNVVGYSKSGDKILLYFGLDYLVSCDLKENFFAKVETYYDSGWKAPIICLESLVPVGGA